jgi:hypothetical protein
MGGIPVVLHLIWGDGHETNYTTVSSSGMPYAGAYVFDYVYATSDVQYAYVTAEATVLVDTYAGRSNNGTLEKNHTTTGKVVLQPPAQAGKAAVLGKVTLSNTTAGASGVPMTLHVVWDNGTELATYTTTSGTAPYNGGFVFEDVDVVPGTYAYVSGNMHWGGSLFGYSRNFTLEPGSTATAPVIIESGWPNGILVSASPKTVDGGQTTSTITAQLYMNGEPYGEPWIALPVQFSSDNDAVATLPAQKTVTTDANGQATIALTYAGTPGTVNVTAKVDPMYIPQNLQGIARVTFMTGVVPPDPVPAAISSPPFSAITGMVQDSYGSHYGGLAVTVHSMRADGSEYGSYTSTTDPQGRYQLVGLPGSTEVHHFYVTSEVNIGATIRGASVNVTREPGCSLPASIVMRIPMPDAVGVSPESSTMSAGSSQNVTAQIYLGGLPYHRPGMMVRFYADNETVGTLSTAAAITDVSGQANVTLNAAGVPGRVNVTANMTLMTDLGLATIGDTAPVDVTNWQSFSISASPDQILKGGDATLITAQLLKNGVPNSTPGVLITFASDNDTIAYLPAVKVNLTDASGQATILLTSNMTAGQVNVTATSPGYDPESVRVGVVEWGCIGGSVVDMNGELVPNAVVTLRDLATNQLIMSPENPQVATSGVMPVPGQFAFYRIPSGTYNLTAGRDGHMGNALVTVTRGTSTALITISGYDCPDGAPALPQPAPSSAGHSSLYGLVLDKNKNPIPGATVMLWEVSDWNNVALATVSDNPTTTLTASPAGGYSFLEVPYGNYNVTAEISGRVYFTRVVLDSSTDCYYVVIPDLVYIPPPLCTVSMYYEKVSLPEGDMRFQVRITRSGDVNTTCSVTYTTNNGTALRGSDFPWRTCALQFNPGETSKVVLVPMIDDRYAEPDQFLFVNLTAPVGATLGKDFTICEIRASDPLGMPEP